MQMHGDYDHHFKMLSKQRCRVPFGGILVRIIVRQLGIHRLLKTNEVFSQLISFFLALNL